MTSHLLDYIDIRVFYSHAISATNSNDPRLELIITCNLSPFLDTGGNLPLLQPPTPLLPLSVIPTKSELHLCRDQQVHHSHWVFPTQRLEAVVSRFSKLAHPSRRPHCPPCTVPSSPVLRPHGLWLLSPFQGSQALLTNVTKPCRLGLPQTHA